MNTSKLFQLTLLLSCFATAPSLLAEDHDHGSEGHSAEGSTEGGQEAAEEGTGVRLTDEQLAIAGITVETLQPKIMDRRIYAPGEVKANGYRSYFVSPRVDSVVIKRHITLGEHVEEGQVLVTLFSETVASAQGEYRIAYAEWQRVKKLGRKTVSEKRLLEAQTAYESSRGKLKAYGLSETAIHASASNRNAALGEYQLDAKQSGAVLSDEFHQGQRVAAGDAIIVVADESELWVEARLPANAQLNLPFGTEAELVIGDQQYVAKVIQEAHTIDAQTRTRVVRLIVENRQHLLHPGMFGDVNFLFATKTPVLAVSESALMRSADGDWIVFVQDDDGELLPVEVELGRSFGDSREISGIEAGVTMVTKGAFFVASQLAKGGFDPHNH